ncbi:hypothetical protein GCM10010232_47760 [Streptomyces amakusaensis]|uniref:SpdD protein n=1 Tax=Streptomyces amakusaensis TaxID=67271 RepID=A0ABW0ANT9_9ACTN
MLRPRVPVNPLPTSHFTRTDIEPSARDHTPPARLTPAGLVTLAAGGTGLVLIVGTVLVSMLLAVAISATSVAVCAVVLRSLLNGQRRHR